MSDAARRPMLTHLSQLDSEELAELLDGVVPPERLAVALLRVVRVSNATCSEDDGSLDSPCLPGCGPRLCPDARPVPFVCVDCCRLHACEGSALVLDKTRRPLGAPNPQESPARRARS